MCVGYLHDSPDVMPVCCCVLQSRLIWADYLEAGSGLLSGRYFVLKGRIADR